MRRRPITGTSSRQLADHEEGFSANGESMYSRRSANPPVTMVGYVGKTKGKHTIGQLIRYHSSLLAKLNGDLMLTTDPVRRARIEKSIAIKSRFVERLKSETGDEHDHST
jgi:hypothetical protein